MKYIINITSLNDLITRWRDEGEENIIFNEVYKQEKDHITM